MREIKFNVWDIDNKRMFNDCLRLTNKGEVRWVQLSQASENLIWLQYTGSKDKNGKEIYEGNIVNVKRMDSFSSWNKAIITYGDFQASFLLQYTKPIEPKGILAECSQITSEDKKTLFGHIYQWEVEAIGNIYENPELLK